MEKIIPLFLVGVLVLSGLGAVALPGEVKNIEKLSISFSQPIIQNEKEFVTVSIDEANEYILEQGKPMLPCYNERFTFPFGTKIKSVTCTPTNIEKQSVSKNILPTPQSAIISQTSTIVKQKTINYGNELYPTDWLDYRVGSGLVNGNLGVIVDVQVNPVRYHPIENTILCAQDVEILIDFEPPEAQPQPLEDYELIVIAPDEYSDELAPLINWKNNDMGITAKFVGLNEINSGTGRDTQEKVKYYIKDSIENSGTKKVLLVGGATKFPTRDVHIYIDRPSGEPDDDEIFVSDLYYADIYDEEGDFSSWDSNDNNRFGEYDWNGQYDEMDLVPDVYLGRLATTSGTQVETCVDKIMTYEYDHAYEQDWFKNLVLIGGDSFPDDDDYLEGEDGINTRVANMMDDLDFIPDKVWVTNGRLTGLIPLGITEVRDAISAGCGFVDFSGHGNPAGWATHPHKNFGTWVPTPYPGGYKNTHVASLTNGYELPIVVVEACSTSKFPSNSNCFNWAFMHNPNGGAIGTFGATALGWGYTGKYVYYGLIGKMGLDTFKAYRYDDSRILGEIWVNALDRYYKANMEPTDYKTLLEWQIFGDPSLQIGPESGAPEKPQKPDGPTHGDPHISYTYSTSTTDPDNDKISYLFDWGDGTDSGWMGPYNSGDTASANHAWSEEKIYQVKVKAMDDHGKESAWSDPLQVSLPRSKPKVSTEEGTFTAEMGKRGSQDPEIFLEGDYRVRNRYKVIWGTADAGEKQGRFRGIFISNHFIIRAPTPRITLTVLGRCTFDGNDFSGQWISRPPYANGWIEGEFTPS